MPPRSTDTAQLRANLLAFVQSTLTVEMVDPERILISTPFTYPYDDPIVLYLNPTEENAWVISDNGDTVYWLNEVNGFDADRVLTAADRTFWDVNCELYGTRRRANDHLEVDADLDNIGSAVFRLVQTIIHLLGPEPRYA